MSRRRSVVTGLAGALAMTAIVSTTALAAVQRAVLAPDSGPPGTSFTLHVETTARWDAALPGVIYLMPKAALEVTAEANHCDAVDGAIAIGQMAWQTGRVTFGAGTYDGFIGDGTFVVPEAAAGTYQLGENIDARGTGCHLYATFTVTSGSLPDTALPSAPIGDTLGLALLAGFLAIGGYHGARAAVPVILSSRSDPRRGAGT